MTKTHKHRTIDDKISELFKITNNFPYIEYYSHLGQDCYKIDNEYTDYKLEIIVLCPMSDGFEKALDIAIKEIKNKSHDKDTQTPSATN